MGLALGGNARAGLEDCLYLRKGVLAQNSSLVKRAVDLVGALDLELADVATTEKLLALPKPK
jgi:uncharacterized protein (DUF849 family)